MRVEFKALISSEETGIRAYGSCREAGPIAFVAQCLTESWSDDLRDDFFCKPHYIDAICPDHTTADDLLIYLGASLNRKFPMVENVLSCSTLLFYQSFYQKNPLCQRGLLYRCINTAAPLSISLIDPEAHDLKAYLIFSANAGEVWHGKIKGVTFRFNSHEGNKHSSPHIHVDYKHEVSLVIDILTGAVIEPDEASRKRVPAKTLRAILEVLSAKREEAVFFWNEFTDGREIDLNAAWEQTDFIPDVAAAQKKASPCRHKDSTPI